MEIYPSSITGWQNKTYIGVSGVTDDATFLEQGIYEYGSRSDQFPEVLNYTFNISTGTTKSLTVKIGMVKGFGKDLYWGWRDNATYGVDKVIVTDSAATTGSWESMIFDDGEPQKSKLAVKIIIEFLPLATGESVTPKYRVERATNFTDGTAASTVGNTRVELPIYARFYEIEYGFGLASSSGTFPSVTSVKFFYDENETETSES